MAFMKPEYRTGLWLEVIAAGGEDAYYLPTDLFAGSPGVEESRNSAASI